jgi:translation initiation factor IF-2
LATVRIYKVAELLEMPSTEVLELLKREGIELKSASSTVEEVVARSFTERLAREKGLALPGGDWFGTAPSGGRKAAKKAEPPKPVQQRLGPPRLVKKPKAAPAESDDPAEAPADVALAEPPAAEAPGLEAQAEAAVAVEPAPAGEAPVEPPVDPDIPPATGRSH